MSQPRNLVIQSEPLTPEISRLLMLAGRDDPAGRRALDHLGVAMTASFSARGGMVFVGYCDGLAVAVGAFSPLVDGRAQVAAALLGPHRSAQSIRRAMLDHVEDAAHLAGWRVSLRAEIQRADLLPERWIGVPVAAMEAHAAYSARA
jgi:hypothetical protein